MTKRSGLLLAVLLATAFLLLNHAAYRGYFQSDELDNLAWAPTTPLTTYLFQVLSPAFQADNFRPVGHFFFYAAGNLFGLNFPPYLIALQAFHLLNVWLLWLVVRRLGAPPLAAGAATAFFALHLALFDAFWKPMYVFDVLSATFCLLSLLCYMRGRWILSILSFWLAYKSKEVAVMLPVVLAGYELWFGKRRWKPLVPFFLISLSFGLQGVLRNPNVNNDYTFRFTPAALAKTSVFYAGRVFLVPYLGFALPLAAWLSRTRRTWFGLAMLAALLVPMLFLPGRVFAAYCYVPFLGLAVCASGVAEKAHPAAIAAFFLLWTPLELHELHIQRRPTLALDDQVREWVTTLDRYSAKAPAPRAVVYSGIIPGFASWGMEGAIHCIFGDLNLPVRSIDNGGADLLTKDGAILLVWKPGFRKLTIVDSETLSIHPSYLRMDGTEPPGDLVEGWYKLEDDFRWIAPHSVVRLRRPADARGFSLRGGASGDMLRAVGPVTVRVAIDGRELPARQLDKPGRQTIRWEVPPAPAGYVLVTIDARPPFHPPNDSRALGLAVAALGFEP
jgi:hypothetical protein